MVENSEASSSQIETNNLSESPIPGWAAKVEALLEEKLSTLNNLNSEQLQKIKDSAKGLGSSSKRIGQVALLAGGITLLSACGGDTSPTATPFILEQVADTATPTVITEPTQDPEATATTVAPVVAEQPATTTQKNPALVTPETEIIEDLRIGGYLKINPDNPSIESVMLHVSEQALTGNTLEIMFFLKSDPQITKISFPFSEWLSEKLIPIDFSSDATLPYNQVDTPGAIRAIIMQAEQSGITFQNPEILNEIKVIHSLLPEGLGIHITLPNQNLMFSDAQGSYVVNLAHTFAKNGSFDIKRYGDLAPGTQLMPAELKATNVSLVRDEEHGGSMVLPDFDIKPPTVVTVRNNGSSVKVQENVQTSVTASSTVSEQPTTSSTSAEPTATPIIVRIAAEPQNSEKESNKEWQPDETTPMSTWWNEMQSRGYIQISDLAKQFGGDQLQTLNDIINNGSLIPNPKDFPLGFSNVVIIGNCAEKLREVVSESQGQITISQQAFDQIPGGENCMVFIQQ